MICLIFFQLSEIDNVFVGEVRIKDYGEKANEDLATRFNVSPDKAALPELVVFTAGQEGGLQEVARYGGDWSIENLRLFVTSKTGVYIKLDGCIK